MRLDVPLSQQQSYTVKYCKLVAVCTSRPTSYHTSALRYCTTYGINNYIMNFVSCIYIDLFFEARQVSANSPISPFPPEAKNFASADPNSRFFAESVSFCM